MTDPNQKENLGIIVHYKVKVKLCLGPLGGDVVAELPFILMHPKPEDEPKEGSCENNATNATTTNNSNSASNHVKKSNDPANEQNLIQLDA